MKSGSEKDKKARTQAGGVLRAKPLIGIAAGAAVGSAAIAAALIFSGRLRNPFVDATTDKEDGTPSAKGAPAPARSDAGEDAAFERSID